MKGNRNGGIHGRGTGDSVAAAVKRIDALDWPRVTADLDANGYAVVRAVLSAGQCTALARLYAADELFRNRIVMARHAFGRGEYKYFAYPLPAVVAALRTAL